MTSDGAIDVLTVKTVAGTLATATLVNGSATVRIAEDALTFDASTNKTPIITLSTDSGFSATLTITKGTYSYNVTLVAPGCTFTYRMPTGNYQLYLVQADNATGERMPLGNCSQGLLFSKYIKFDAIFYAGVNVYVRSNTGLKSATYTLQNKRNYHITLS